MLEYNSEDEDDYYQISNFNKQKENDVLEEKENDVIEEKENDVIEEKEDNMKEEYIQKTEEEEKDDKIL